MLRSRQAPTMPSAWVDSRLHLANFTPASAVTSTVRSTTPQGNVHLLTTIFRKTGDNEWVWETYTGGGAMVGDGTLRFNTHGQLIAATGRGRLTLPRRAPRKSPSSRISARSRSMWGNPASILTRTVTPMGYLDGFTHR